MEALELLGMLFGNIDVVFHYEVNIMGLNTTILSILLWFAYLTIFIWVVQAVYDYKYW